MSARNFIKVVRVGPGHRRKGARDAVGGWWWGALPEFWAHQSVGVMCYRGPNFL